LCLWANDTARGDLAYAVTFLVYDIKQIQGCTASYYETFDITKYNSIMKYVESSVFFFILKLILISDC